MDSVQEIWESAELASKATASKEIPIEELIEKLIVLNEGLEPEDLGFFLVQVAQFVWKWGPTFLDVMICVSYLGSRMEAWAAQCCATLYHDKDAEVKCSEVCAGPAGAV